MNSLENLIRYRDDDYYKIPEVAIKIQRAPQSEVDAILDRINEINEMIQELEKEE